MAPIQKNRSQSLLTSLINHYNGGNHVSERLPSKTQLAIHQANLTTTDSEYICRPWRKEADAAVKEASQFATNKQMVKQDAMNNGRLTSGSECLSPRISKGKRMWPALRPIPEEREASRIWLYSSTEEESQSKEET